MNYVTNSELSLLERQDREEDSRYAGGRIISPQSQGFLQRFRQSREFYEKNEIDHLRIREYNADIDSSIDRLKELGIEEAQSGYIPFSNAQKETIVKKYSDVIGQEQQLDPEAEVFSFEQIQERQKERLTELNFQRNSAVNNSTLLGRFGSLSGMLVGFLEDPINIATLPLYAAIGPGATLAGTLAKNVAGDIIIGAFAEAIKAPDTIEFKQRFLNPEFSAVDQLEESTINVAVGAGLGAGLTVIGHSIARSFSRAHQQGRIPKEGDLDDLATIAEQIDEIGIDKHPNANMEEHFQSMAQGSENFLKGENINVSDIHPGSPERSMFDAAEGPVMNVEPEQVLNREIANFKSEVEAGEFNNELLSVTMTNGEKVTAQEFVKMSDEILDGIKALDVCLRENS